MSLVAYTITALERDVADATASGKQVIVGATCSMYSQPSDTVVTLYDDAAGSNGSTAKVTSENGQVVVYVEPGEYRLSVNGIDSFITIGGSAKITTSDLIALDSASSVGDVIDTTGYSVAGDGGGGQWVSVAATGAASQSPSQLGDALLNDANGNQWVLLPINVTNKKSYSAKALGVVGDGIADDTAAIQAGLSAVIYGNNLTCKITSRLLCTVANAGFVGDIKLVGDTASFNREDGLYDNANGTILDVQADEFIFDGATIKLDTNVNPENTTTGLLLRSANNFKIINSNFNTFSKTKVIRIEDCDNGSITYSKVHSCLLASATTGQLTAIDIDDNRPSSTYSENIEIANCHIYDMLASAGFVTSFGYQTDGINISKQPSYGHKIHHNNIRNVGDAIDCFGGRCVIHDNYLEDVFNAGVKVINGATYNKVYANTVVNAGKYGIGVFGAASVGNDTVGNLVYKNHIQDTNSDNTSTGTTAALWVADNGGASLPKSNVFCDNFVHNSINCDRIALNESVDSTNSFINTKVTGTVPAQKTLNTARGVMTFADKTRVVAYNSAQSIPPGGATADLANVVEDTNSELSGTTYTAQYPRIVNIEGSIRTAGANANKYWRIGVNAGGSEVARSQTTATVGGDLYIYVSANGVKLNEGDSITFYINQDQDGAANITSDPLYDFRIIEAQ